MAPLTPLSSPVWRYYTKDGNSVICNLCLERKEGVANTSNMRKHLASKKHNLKEFEARGSSARGEGRPKNNINVDEEAAVLDDPAAVSI